MPTEALHDAHYSIRAEVIGFEDTDAVLRLEHGGELRWSIRQLPDDAKKGASVQLILSTRRTEDEERERLAKSILNHILKGT